MTATAEVPTIKQPAFYAFATHRDACPKCSAVDVDHPRTLIAACLEGSRLVKDAYAEHWKRGRV